MGPQNAHLGLFCKKQIILRLQTTKETILLDMSRGGNQPNF